MRLFEPAGAPRLTVAALGDVAVIGRTRARARTAGYDALFRAAAPALRAADVGFANLEMPVGEPGWVRAGRSPEFWQEEDTVGALARAGVHVVSLANNHVMDCGARGITRTREACARAGLHAIGAGRDLAEARLPARFEARGARIVALAYAHVAGRHGDPAAPGVAPLEIELVREDLARWRSAADVMLVSVHWGSMYVDYPPPRVGELAHALVAGGADLVLGHHPHVVQGAWREGGAIVLYSLGDAMFDAHAGDFHASTASATRRGTGVFTITLADTPGLDVAPLTLDDDGVPEASAPAEAARQVERLRHLSVDPEVARARFASECAPQLLRYELEGLGQYLRRGRIDRVVALLGSLRPRHARTLWRALRGRRRAAG